MPYGLPFTLASCPATIDNNTIFTTKDPEQQAEYAELFEAENRRHFVVTNAMEEKFNSAWDKALETHLQALRALNVRFNAGPPIINHMPRKKMNGKTDKR